MDVPTAEAIDAVFGTVIDQVVARVQVLVVREDEPFVGRRTKVSLQPQQLVRPRAGVSQGDVERM